MIEPALLDRIPALRGLPSEAKTDLAGLAWEVLYPKGRAIYPLMAPPQNLHMLLEGLAKMSGIAAGGVERIIYVYRRGEILGSRVLLEASPESSYEVRAVLPVRALVVSKQDFLASGRRHPDLLIAVTDAFSRRLHDTTRRVLSAMTADVPVRLCQLLLDFANGAAEAPDGFVPLDQPLTHETMAQIIGASRPHTSTVLGDLEDLGVVRRRRRQGLLVDPGRLREIVTSEMMVGVRA